MEVNNKIFDINSCKLHVMAMLFMLLDHMWATVTPGKTWMTCVGRMAFPLFAFMIVEGYFYTKSLKRYLLRILGFAILSEIPFDYMYGNMPFYPYHQNVMWTFLIALIGIYLMDKMIQNAKTKEHSIIKYVPVVIGCFGVILLSGLLAFAGMTDYYGTGVWMVYVFYFFHGRRRQHSENGKARISFVRNWWDYLGQLLCLYYLNVEVLGGLYYPVRILGHDFELVQQGIALFSLIPIWLYQGEQGFHAKWFQYFCYAFYPLHILILVICR